MSFQFSTHQSKFFAHHLTSEGIHEEDALAQSLSGAKVDLNPHQVDAATFALRSPLSKGVLLADEVGLGKTIEAALVISQRWWERERNILLIVPASLRKQWATELHEKFSLPSFILDAKRVKDLEKAGTPNPIGRGEGIIIISYEYAARIADTLRRTPWSLVVFDEAHKLRNVYKAADNSRASILRKALAGRQKLLLTATPLQNNLMELYGLISIIDETYFGSEQAFKSEFGGREGLPEARFHHDHAQRFDYAGETWSTEWPEADERGWRFFRLGDDGLADRLIQQAKTRDLAPVMLRFDYSAYQGNMGDVALLRGQSGWMRVARVHLKTPAKVYDELVIAAFTDAGATIDPETAARMLYVPAKTWGLEGESLPETDLTHALNLRQTEIVGVAQERLSSFLNEEEERLDAWREDAKVSFDQQIKALNREAAEKKKLARATLALEEKVTLQREAKALQRQVDDLQHQLYTRLREIDDEGCQVEARIAGRLDDDMRTRLDALLTEDAGGSVTRFVWLRQFEIGRNSADMNRLLDRLEFLQGLGLAETVLADVPPHRIARLRRQGERYFAGDLRDISGDRRLAILAVCALEWRSSIADAVVETHDRIVGKTWREAKSRCDARMDDARSALKDTLQSFKTLGAALLEAHEDRASLEEAVGNAGGWISLKGLVATAVQLTDTFAADPLAHVGHGYHRFRRYAPRMLRVLDICAAPVAEPLLAAGAIIAGTATTGAADALRHDLRGQRDRAQADEAEPSLEQWSGRADEPHDQGSDRQALPLR